MGRLFRFTRALLGPASLLIYLATILFWINSAVFTSKDLNIRYEKATPLPGGATFRQRLAQFRVNDGGVILAIVDEDIPPFSESGIPMSRGFVTYFGDDPDWFLRGRASFWPTMSVPPYPVGVGWRWRMFLPLWVICILSMIPSAIWLTRIRRRFPTGFCQKCGYDLRATPDLCPECGSIPEKPPIPYNPQRSIK